VAQNGKCGICDEKFTEYTDIVAYADIGIPCPITSIPAAWAERGRTIIRKTSRLFTGGAMGRKGLLGSEALAGACEF
jgi:hypothetical protein